VLDNLSAHETKAVEEFLQQNPKVQWVQWYSANSRRPILLESSGAVVCEIQCDAIARGRFIFADLACKLSKSIRAYAKSA